MKIQIAILALIIILVLGGCGENSGSTPKDVLSGSNTVKPEVKNTISAPVSSGEETKDSTKIIYYNSLEARFTSEKTLVIGGKGKLNSKDMLTIQRKLDIEEGDVKKNSNRKNNKRAR